MNHGEIGWRACWAGFGVTYGALLLSACMSPLLCPLALACGLTTGTALYSRDVRRSELAQAVEDGDDRLSLLIDALDCEWDANIRALAAQRLTSVLTAARPASTVALSERQWMRLRRALAVRSAIEDPDLALAVLAAIRQAEQIRALPHVDRLARLHVRHTERLVRVQRAAEACREALLRRLERERSGRDLLRPTERPDADLLRPAPPAADSYPLLLLRAPSDQDYRE